MGQVTFDNAGEGGRVPGHEGLELLIQTADGGVHILPGADTCSNTQRSAAPVNLPRLPQQHMRSAAPISLPQLPQQHTVLSCSTHQPAPAPTARIMGQQSQGTRAGLRSRGHLLLMPAFLLGSCVNIYAHRCTMRVHACAHVHVEARGQHRTPSSLHCMFRRALMESSG